MSLYLNSISKETLYSNGLYFARNTKFEVIGVPNAYSPPSTLFSTRFHVCAFPSRASTVGAMSAVTTVFSSKVTAEPIDPPSSSWNVTVYCLTQPPYNVNTVELTPSAPKSTSVPVRDSMLASVNGTPAPHCEAVE